MGDEFEFVVRQLARVLPGSKLFLVTSDEVLIQREAVIRSLFALSRIPEVFGDPEAFDGFNTLRTIHVDGTSGLMTHLRYGMNILAPHLLGYASHGCYCSFVILFDSPIDYRVDFPALPVDAFRTDSTFLMEDRESMDNDERFDLKSKLTSKDAETYLRWYISALNGLMGFLTDPQYFGRIDSPTTLDPDLWHQAMLFVNRVYIEAGVIQTCINRGEYFRKVTFFALLDKLARLVQATSPSRVKDWEVFKRMLTRSFGEARLIAGLAGIPEPMKGILIAKAEEAYRSTYEVAIAGIWVKDCLKSGGRVKINSGATALDQSEEEYVVDLLRNIRNTHHGYFEAGKSECPLRLIVHNGNTSDLLPDLGPLWVLALTANPGWFLAGAL